MIETAIGLAIALALTALFPLSCASNHETNPTDAPSGFDEVPVGSRRRERKSGTSVSFGQLG
jgi:hypothetical protein